MKSITLALDFKSEKDRKAFQEGNSTFPDWCVNITKGIIGKGDDARDWINFGDKIIGNPQIEDIFEKKPSSGLFEVWFEEEGEL